MEPDIDDWDKNYRFKFEQKQQWKKYLQVNGFVVVSWLSTQQCDKYVQRCWDIMQILGRGKLKRNDQSTQVLSANYPPVLHGGMIQYVAHTQFQWDLRKRCKPIFEAVWETKDLKSSFDGFCFMNGVRNYQKKAINSFLHCDQSPTKNFLWSYQGVMTLTDSGENEGGFVVVPRSNHYHHKYFQEKNMLGEKANWFLVPEQDKLKEPFSDCVKINSKAGDFILFDSRTFHCNTIPNLPKLRVCTYICMIPSKKVHEKTLQMRKKAFKDKRTTNHHPGDGFKVFPVLPRFTKQPDQFLKIVKQISDPILDQQMQSLI